MEKILSAEEVAEYLGIAKETVYRKARKGEIPASRVGRMWRFPLDLIDEWLRDKAKRPGPWRYTKRTSLLEDPLLKVIGIISDGNLAKGIDKIVYGE